MLSANINPKSLPKIADIWNSRHGRDLVIGSLVLLTVVAGLFIGVSWSVTRSLTASALAQATAASARLAVAGLHERRPTDRPDTDGVPDRLGADHLAIRSADGRLVFSTFQGDLPQLADGLLQGVATAAPSNDLYAVAVQPMADGSDAIAAVSLSTVTNVANALKWWLGAAVLLVAVIVMAGGIWIDRRARRRLQALVATSQAVMSGDLTQRLALAGAGDELDQLSAAVNRMLDRIEELMASLREVSDNIAHDLKTPLARLRLRAETALRDARSDSELREALADAIDDADAMLRTFNAMLQIARLEAGAMDATGAPVDLGQLIEELAEFYQPIAEDAGVELQIDIAKGIHVSGHRSLIQQSLANLIENAIKYGRPVETTARHRVVVRADDRNGHARVTVADSGRGIAPEDRERALTRFVRLDASRTASGSGLGLALVAAVTRIHQGSLNLADNHPGLAVHLTLPSLAPGHELPAKWMARRAAEERTSAAQEDATVGR